MTHTHQKINDSRDIHHLKILIIGGGFAGLGAAIRLAQAGEDDFLVIERGDDVGGAWRDNTYPGAECDVPSHLYSYSFDQNPNWSRSFSPQAEIERYLHDSAQRHRVLDRHRFNTSVTAARWDAGSSRWVVETSNGTFAASILINASGALSEPSLPGIPGIGSFTGDFFHSARWNHDVSLTGRRLAVIGTGASAIQIVPELVKIAAHVDVYQRTAAWIVPRVERRYRAPERWIYRHAPVVQRLARAGIYTERELLVFGLARRPSLMNVPRKFALAHLGRQVPNAALRAALTPDWQIGCKRILISNKWYPALQRPNVELVTDPIREIRPDGIVTGDGTLRPVDAIVLATGFHVTDPPIADVITGAAGVSLGEVWRVSGQQAYKGTTVSGFPNLSCLSALTPGSVTPPWST